MRLPTGSIDEIRADVHEDGRNDEIPDIDREPVHVVGEDPDTDDDDDPRPRIAFALTRVSQHPDAHDDECERPQRAYPPSRLHPTEIAEQEQHADGDDDGAKDETSGKRRPVLRIAHASPSFRCPSLEQM